MKYFEEVENIFKVFKPAWKHWESLVTTIWNKKEPKVDWKQLPDKIKVKNSKQLMASKSIHHHMSLSVRIHTSKVQLLKLPKTVGMMASEQYREGHIKQMSSEKNRSFNYSLFFYLRRCLLLKRMKGYKVNINYVDRLKPRKGTFCVKVQPFS